MQKNKPLQGNAHAKRPVKFKRQTLPSERPPLSAKKGRLNLALLQAAWDGDDKKIRRLIRAGADITAKDSDDWTVLHRAAHLGYTQTCLLLINEYAKSGRDVKELIAAKTDREKTAWHEAAEMGYIKTAQFLNSMEFLADTAGNGFTMSFARCAKSPIPSLSK